MSHHNVYPTPLKLGILLSEGVQLLDVAPIDMFGMLEKSYLTACGLPPALVEKGLDIEYYFINEEGKGPNPMTGGFKVAVTVRSRILSFSDNSGVVCVSALRMLTRVFPKHGINDCPPLDILLIGGPTPSYRPSPAVQKFLQEQYHHVSAFMTVCTGYILALHSGVLDHKTATAPLGLLPMLKEEAPQVKWVEKRWVRDGKVWTSGAVANGMEMMAGFMRSEFGDRKEVVEAVLGLSDYSVRGVEYPEDMKKGIPGMEVAKE
ncbi:MAG: hypothetical protein Q9218_000943 [Villophora microphyllina]